MDKILNQIGWLKSCTLQDSFCFTNWFRILSITVSNRYQHGTYQCCSSYFEQIRNKQKLPTSAPLDHLSLHPALAVDGRLEMGLSLFIMLCPYLPEQLKSTITSPVFPSC